MAYLLICYDADDRDLLVPIFEQAGARHLWPHAMMVITHDTAVEFQEKLKFPPGREAAFLITEIQPQSSFLALRLDHDARWFGAHWIDEILNDGGRIERS